MKFILAIPLLLVHCVTARGRISEDFYDTDEVKDELLTKVLRGYVAEKMKNDFMTKLANKYMALDVERESDDNGMDYLNQLAKDGKENENLSPENINDELHMKITGDHSSDHIGHGDIMFQLGEEEAIFEGGSDDVSGYADATTRFAKWPNPVPYVIDNSLGSDARTAINDAINEFKARTCIRFVQRTNQNDYLFIHKGVGCWSYVGRKKGKQSLSLGNGCQYKSTAIHEFMHALGFFHEQSRPDRDTFVTINWDNIEKGAAGQFTKQKASDVTTFGHPYDYRSVMHYFKTDFGKKYTESSGWFFWKSSTTKRRETITPKRNTELGQCPSCGMTSIDAAQLNAMYC